jgi:four helix bundle protein
MASGACRKQTSWESHIRIYWLGRGRWNLVAEVYRYTRSFPKEELYGLTSQMRRAAVSVPSNIAEGQGRRGAGEFKHFLRTSLGSLMELETQIMIAERLHYLEPEPAKSMLQDAAVLGRVINGLINSLK